MRFANQLTATFTCMACFLPLDTVFAQGVDISKAPTTWRNSTLDGSDSLIATNSYGKPLFVVVNQAVAKPFEPGAVTSAGLVTVFKRVCLDTGFSEQKLAAAMADQSFGFKNRTLVVPPRKDGASFSASIWTTAGARAQIWPGDVSALKDRSTISRWRRGVTTMPFKTNRVASPACNISLMAKGFNDAAGVVTLLSKELGVQPAKSVLKPEWADGHWLATLPDGEKVRVSFSFVDFDKPEQLLHLAVSRADASK